jgi:hypothetical protein
MTVTRQPAAAPSDASAPAMGDPVIVEAAADGSVDNLVLRWKGADWPMRETAPGRYEGLIGVDLDDPAGPAVEFAIEPLDLRTAGIVADPAS